MGFANLPDTSCFREPYKAEAGSQVDPWPLSKMEIDSAIYDRRILNL